MTVVDRHWEKKFKISTHTLTWSVTYILINRQTHTQISTHTLTWSVTNGTTTASYINFNFNSHAHVERDHIYLSKSPVEVNFNSHAHVERDNRIYLDQNH